MDNLKEAFKKVKQDIDSLKDELTFLKNNLFEDRAKLIEICEILKQLNQKIEKVPPSTDLQFKSFSPAVPTENSLFPTFSTNPSTDIVIFNPLKNQNLDISIGNKGVPTDQQTNQQTNQQTKNPLFDSENKSLKDAGGIIDSLDNIKRDLRIKFKKLTDQELLVFSTIYQFDEVEGYSDYKSLSKKLGLSESSIRDYIGRLLQKGIPVEKTKINNKNIQLSISQNLKRIASLHTILQLREM